MAALFEQHLAIDDRVVDAFSLLLDPPAAGWEIVYDGLVAAFDRVRVEDHDIGGEARPQQCTFVPDSAEQATSDHGWDLARDGARLAPLVAEARALGVRVSLFMDADSADIERAAEIGAERVEIYTGPYAEAFTRNDYRRELEACARAAERARAAGLGVNAGHDLSQSNLAKLKGAIPSLAEVSIGHALIGEALYAGLAPTVRAYLQLLA